jgi:hypothetical protein
MLNLVICKVTARLQKVKNKSLIIAFRTKLWFDKSRRNTEREGQLGRTGVRIDLKEIIGEVVA